VDVLEKSRFCGNFSKADHITLYTAACNFQCPKEHATFR